MLDDCLRACIAADYELAWDRILLGQTEDCANPLSREHKLERLAQVVTYGMDRDALDSPNPKYLDDLSSVAGLLEQMHEMHTYDLDWEQRCPIQSLQRERLHTRFFRKPDPVVIDDREGGYLGMTTIPDLEFTVFARDTVEQSSMRWEKDPGPPHLQSIEAEELYEILEIDRLAT